MQDTTNERAISRRRFCRLGAGFVFALGLTDATATAIPAQTPPVATGTPVSTPVSGTPSDVESEIVWAREIESTTNEPKRVASSFETTDETIYAVLAVARIEQGSVVEATWVYNGIPVPALTATITADRTYMDGWIAFHLTHANGEIWPTGEYAVTIAINGHTVAEASVEVTVPPS